MKVKIIKASKSSYWYNQNIGDIFEVIEDDIRNYRVINNQEHSFYYILKDDCIIIDESKTSIINLNKNEINIIMNLISERIVDMKQRQNEIDINKFEQLILLGVKIENEWLRINSIN